MRLSKPIARLVAATTAAGLMLTPLAYADRDHRGRGHGGYERGYDRGHDRGHQRGHKHDHKYQHRHYQPPKYHYAPPPRVHYAPPPPRAYYAPPPRSSVTVSYGYTYGPHYYRGYTPRYTVGGHYGYAPRTVYISDYHRHGLYAPPSGYHWVRDNDRGDAILASVATGAIIGLAVGILSN